MNTYDIRQLKIGFQVNQHCKACIKTNIGVCESNVSTGHMAASN